MKLKSRHWRGNEITTFFKDEWKVTRTLTLNLGLKWEYYGVPYALAGLAGRTVGGLKGLCGVGCGALTTVELVGNHSPSQIIAVRATIGTIQMFQPSVSASPYPVLAAHHCSRRLWSELLRQSIFGRDGYWRSSMPAAARCRD